MERTEQHVQQPSPAEPVTLEDLAETAICPTCAAAPGTRCATQQPSRTAAPVLADENATWLAQGYLRGYRRHGERDAWLTHGRALAKHLGLTGETYDLRQQVLGLALQADAAPAMAVTR